MEDKQQEAETNWQKGIHVSRNRTLPLTELNSKYLGNIIAKYKEQGYDVSTLLAEQERRTKLELFI
jgi:hypothetical protein